MSITRKARTTIAGLAAAAAVTAVALPAAPAHAAVGPMTANLDVTPVLGEPGYQWVHVHGNVPMSQAEAQQLINSRHNVVARLWGEDSFSDDLLMGPYEVVSGAYYGGLWFSVAHKVSDSQLNEDWGEDEIYAGVRLVRPNSETLRSDETNRVKRSF